MCALDSSNDAIRAAAGLAISRFIRECGTNVLSWTEINQGFRFGDQQIHFASKAVGIFKPKQINDGVALSIKQVRPSRAGRVAPYDDRELADGLVAYRLEKSGRDNDYLREAWARRIPIIFFRGLADAQYEVLYPVFVQAIDFAKSEAIIAIDDAPAVEKIPKVEEEPIERSYSVGTRKARRHQAAFRRRVLLAYGLRCAVSGLPLTRLLEAAHIIPDTLGGEASVRNGIAMSTLHHAAYEADLIGIDPDGVLHVSEQVRATRDGPLLEHGLVRIEGQKLRFPAFAPHQPNRDFLSVRFDEFRKRWS